MEYTNKFKSLEQKIKHEGELSRTRPENIIFKFTIILWIVGVLLTALLGISVWAITRVVGWPSEVAWVWYRMLLRTS